MKVVLTQLHTRALQRCFCNHRPSTLASRLSAAVLCRKQLLTALRCGRSAGFGAASRSELLGWQTPAWNVFGGAAFVEQDAGLAAANVKAEWRVCCKLRAPACMLAPLETQQQAGA